MLRLINQLFCLINRLPSILAVRRTGTIPPAKFTGRIRRFPGAEHPAIRLSPDIHIYLTSAVLGSILLLGSPSESRSQQAAPVDNKMVRAQALYQADRFQAAIRLYSEAIAQNSSNMEAHRDRGLAYMRLSDFGRAIDDFKAANADMGLYRETKFPGFGTYADWKRAQEEYQDANHSLESKEYSQAINMYTIALSIYPQYPQCLHNLSIALGKDGDHKGAEIACIKAISWRWNDWKFWKTLGYELYREHKYRASIKATQEAMRLNPPEPDKAELIESLEIVKDRLRTPRINNMEEDSSDTNH